MKMVTNFAVLVVAIAIASTDGFNTNLNSRALATSYGNMVPSAIVSSSMSATIFNAKKDCNLSLRMATLDMEIEDSKQSRSCFRKVVSFCIETASILHHNAMLLSSKKDF
jgi:hypothetical protein